ncbi:Alpha-1A adrenergic receptor [Dirofilaria immitis]
MDNSTKFDNNVTTHIFAIPMALLTLFAYTISLYFIHKSHRYQNIFGLLCISYISFEIQTATALLIWTIVRIIVYLEVVSFPWTIFIRIASPIANSALYAAIWMQFVLATNRFCAISYPMTYHRIFNLKNARITIIFLWSISMIITVLYYNVECVYYFESPVHSWSTLYGPCNHPIFAYIATFLSDGIILISLIIDAVAFYCTITYLKKKKSQRVNVLRQDIFFFKQTCVSTIIHAFFVSIFRIDGPFIARVTKVTYTWLAMSTLDSLVFVFFNRNLLMNRNAVGESAIQITSFQERQRDKRSILMK